MKTFGTSILSAALMLGALTAPGPAAAQECRDSAGKDPKSCCADTTRRDSLQRITPYAKLVKEGGSYSEGLFAVRHIKDKWYFEIADSLPGRLMLAVTRFKAVPQDFRKYGGEEVNRSVVYFEQRDAKTLLLREYVRSQQAGADDRIAEALKAATVDPVIAAFEVIGRNPDTQAQLIDVTKLILADNKLCGFTSKDRSALNLGTLVSDRSFIDTVRTFPINTEVETLRTYGTSSGRYPAASTGAATLKLTTSFVLLPRDPMRPRWADERVGYFQNPLTRFSDSQQATEHEAVIQRYRLEPRDAERYRRGLLTEPVKPIVYYIDPATPPQWVPYLKAGIEDWNAAFEAAGFKNAIQAREWPDDPTMSLEDARFNVLRYLPSETENAYGPRIVDPRSGEIIESHVCWYHNVMNLLKKWYMVQCGPLDPRARTMHFDDELMGTLIRFVSCHEVGHALGLRHNMAASSATPVDRLRDKAWVEKHGHTVSIMDYARFNYVAQPEDKISPRGLFPRVGDYDKWAIAWGYRYRPEFADPLAEKRALRSEVTARLRKDPRLWYVGDEGKGPDPRSQSEDLGDNNMRAGEYGIRNLRRVMEHITEWTAQPDGTYDDLECIYKSVRSQYMKYMMHVQKNIGGRYTDNRPDVPRFGFVPRELQRQAVAWMGAHVLEVPLWLYPDEVVSNLKVNHMDQIHDLQQTALSVLLAPGMLLNIYTASQQSSDPYTVEEYLADVFAAAWKPLDAPDALPNQFRRELHRIYVRQLDRLVNPVSDSSNAMAEKFRRSDALLHIEQHLAAVQSRIDACRRNCTPGSLDDRHYANLERSLRKTLKTYFGEEKK